MHYTMTTPCNACPFLKGSGYLWQSLIDHASGEFACHKTCDLSDETSTYEPEQESLHCAGALIFLEKRTESHQMMRISERLGLYGYRQLSMQAPVVESPQDCRRPSWRTMLQEMAKER